MQGINKDLEKLVKEEIEKYDLNDMQGMVKMKVAELVEYKFNELLHKKIEEHINVVFVKDCNSNELLSNEP